MQNFVSLEGISFLHGALGGPKIKAVKQAIKAVYLKSWPVLTLEALNKFKEPDETHLGHLDHIRKNIQSTKLIEKNINDEFEAVLKTHIETKTNGFFHKIIDIKDTICADQTGAFTCKSISGNRCIFVTY